MPIIKAAGEASRLIGKAAARSERGWNTYVRSGQVLADTMGRAYPYQRGAIVRDILRSRLHQPTTQELEFFYNEGWQGALATNTNIVPEGILLNNQGETDPVYIVTSVFYIPDGKLKSSLYSTLNDLKSILPSNSIWEQPLQTYHIAVCFSSSPLERKDPISDEQKKTSIKLITHLNNIVPRYSPTRLHILGINLNRIGIIFAKVFSEDDSILKIREEFKASDPRLPKQKEVYNLTLGRIYKPLSPGVWNRLRDRVASKYLNHYFGSITLDTIVAVEELKAFITLVRPLFEVNLQGK